MKIFFTADTHFYHNKIIGLQNRPTTIELHNEWLVDLWNSTVNKKDTIYVLGDVSLGNKVNTNKMLDRLHGTKFLIEGNHDKACKNSTRFKHITQIYNFNYSPSNTHIVLCHYPIASWERRVHGSYHLYGHTHGRFQNQGLSFDAGLDANNWRILSLEEVLEKFNLMKKENEENTHTS